MTIATEMWYTGYDPYTLEPVFSAKSAREKLAQRQYFFWYKPEERRGIEQSLRRIGRADLIQKLYAGSRDNDKGAYNHSHEDNRAKRRPQKSPEEKRGRNRRH